MERREDEGRGGKVCSGVNTSFIARWWFKRIASSAAAASRGGNGTKDCILSKKKVPRND